MPDIEQWERLIRRSFGVPDVLGQVTANQLISDHLYEAVREPSEERRSPSHENKLSWSSDVIAQIAEIGAEGKLDRYLAGLPDPAFDPALEVDGGKPTNVALARVVLAKIKEFVDSHPFQADCGCYFT